MYSAASYNANSSFSSPPSSPSPFLDSSPASSPGFDGFIQASDDEVPEFTLSHPFAASANTKWRPPQYEKKRLTPPSSPAYEPAAKKARPSPPEALQPAVRSLEQIEADTWDEAGTKVVDEGHGAVNLENRNLSTIPLSFIADLENFYIPPESSEFINASPKSNVVSRFSRVATAPASIFGTEPRLFTRTRSAATASFGLPREKLQLFISSNNISILPLQLMTLHNLSVLSIRSNQLTYIPPEIILLKNLVTLNVANNQIKYLPAEILQMSLSQLHVHPNPFILPPSQSYDRKGTRIVSDTEQLLPNIIPLVELSFRSLFSPAIPHIPDETILEAHYDLPLDEYPVDSMPASGKQHFPYTIPSHIRKILDICVPRSVYEEEGPVHHNTRNDTPDITGIGRCPSPKHQRLGTSRVFVRHAEQRFSWEQNIANISMGGLVPVRWRGCQRGCLDFLDGAEPKEDAPRVLGEDSDADWSLGSGRNIGEDAEMEDVIHVVQFGISGTGDLEEFDD